MALLTARGAPHPRARARRFRAWRGPQARLLDFDFGADVFELLLDRRSFVLRHAFLDRLGRAFNEILRFLQPEAGHFANDLYDVDLVGTDFGQRRGKFGLLFRRSRAAGRRAAARRHRHRHRRGRRDAELGFERLHELRQFEDRDPLDVIDHLLLIQFGHFLNLLITRLITDISFYSVAGPHPRDLPALAYGSGRLSLGNFLLRERYAAPSAGASPLFFSACTSPLLRSRAGAFRTLTSCTIGACSTKSSLAYSSGFPGNDASSVTSAVLIARP